MSEPANARRAVLVVGGGSIGERHARCFLRADRARVALCEVSKPVRERLAGAYPLCATFPDLEAALAEPWDGVVIATPAHLHVTQALAALDRGAAVLIEKPLATSLREIPRLRERAKASGRAAGVAYVLRAHPAVREARALLAGGTLGPLRHVAVTAGQHFPTFRPAYRDIYYARRETGGGAVQDALTHLADLVQHLAGTLDWVFADWDRQALPGVAVEDTVNVVARAGGGDVLVAMALNQFMASNETRVDLHCERGSLRLELHRHALGRLRLGETEWSWTPPAVTERDDLFLRQAHAFLDAVEGRAAPLCPLEEAESALRVNLSILRSGTRREPVCPATLPLADEPFRAVRPGTRE